MKKFLILFFISTCILPGSKNAIAQDFKEHITREYQVAGNGNQATLYIYNISGFIKVEGYSGDRVILEINKTISADDNKALEQGKKEFKLGFGQEADSIIAYIAEPFDSRPRRNFHSDDNDIEYSFNVDFIVKVPFNINLHISTVNDGIITVNNVYGSLHINNVNEGIQVTNAKSATWAHTVNGDVSVTYLKNPGGQSSYETINGDIRNTYQSDLSADVQFKSMNGDLFTDFSGITKLPATVKNVKEKSDGGKVYKLSKGTTVRIGSGGQIFRFETLNGNVYIKKHS